MSFLTNSIKSAKRVFRRNKNKNDTKTGRTDCSDWLRKSINEKRIKYFEYSDFKKIKFIRENVIRANLKDDFYALLSFSNDNATLQKVVQEVHYVLSFD
jgi:hypothetical protein